LARDEGEQEVVVTEAEWLACSEPQAMLTFLSQRGRFDRKHRLFACACCRRIWGHFPDERNRDLVAAMEDHPELTFEDFEIHDAAVASSAREQELHGNSAYWVAKALGRSFYKMTASVSAAVVSTRVLGIIAPGEQSLGREHAARRAEERALAELLRDVFGNPFRVAEFSPEWRTDTVMALAGQMYDSREFSAMPILADALQDAGCSDELILSHCREEGAHVRGCWAVDLVLGRE
jgi:hypothetical protein